MPIPPLTYPHIPGMPAQPARGVVEVDRGRPRVVRAGVRADHPLPQVGHLQPLVAGGSARRTRPSTTRTAASAPRRRRRAAPRSARASGARPIQRSPLAGGPERVAEPALDVAHRPPARPRRPGAKPADLLLALRRRRPRAGRCSPSSNGTNSPAWPGSTRNPRAGQVQLLDHQRVQQPARGRRRARSDTPARPPPACSAPPTRFRASSTSTRFPARARYAAQVSPLCPAPTTITSQAGPPARGSARAGRCGRGDERLWEMRDW